MRARPTLWLLDAHVQIFRAFHSMPDLRAPDGTPVGAVRGYGAQLLKLLALQKPSHMAAAWDNELTSFRNDLYADYKAGRTEPPPELAPQFELCAELTAALGISVQRAPRFEADDVIATLTARALDQGAEVVIATTDKDLSALVSERVSIFDPKRELLLGPREVQAKMGVPPSSIADYLALVGDAVDHVPGVPGIGAKTAALLLTRFHRIEELPKTANEWKATGLRGAERIRQALERSAETLALARELVRLREDAPVAARLGELRCASPDRNALGVLAERLGWRGLVERAATLGR